MSPPVLVENKPKTSSAAREGLPATEKFVIDLTSFKWEKDAAKSEPAAPKVARMIADMIAQYRGFVVPPIFGFALRHEFGAKFNPSWEMLDAMKSGKVDFSKKWHMSMLLLLQRLIHLLSVICLLLWEVVRNPPSLPL